MDYCQAIADIICRYRMRDRKAGTLPLEINRAHVERWIGQFPKDTDIILAETHKLLQQFYMPKEAIDDYLTKVCTSPAIWGNDPGTGVADALFLDCQTKGISQHRLWTKLSRIIQREYGISIDKKRDPSTYSTFIYVDDCMFSGATLLKDMKNILPILPTGSQVYAVFLMRYGFADWWIHKNLDTLFSDKGIRFETLSCVTIQNSTGGNYPFDCLRPMEYESDQIDEYLEALEQEHETAPEKKIHLFRTPGRPSEVFKSEEDRKILEWALMEAGLYIRSQVQDPKPFIRPMGYDNRISFGFGGFFASYMNMSNNCPLAYWWGDPNMGSWHPLSKWYPLLPRRVNSKEGMI